MRILQLKIKNFRQFYGECELNFLSDDTSRITVIHGENGSGKTSLLNAFKWVLYGTTDFDTGNQTILNELALSETAIGSVAELSLELKFEHEGSTYTVHRKQDFKRTSDALEVDAIGKSVPTLHWINEKGGTETAQNPANRINQLIPEQMHSYFFFNGERIEKLANVSASGEIREAIKTLMGLEIIDRASDHLGRLVIKDLRKEASETASSDYRELLEQEAKINTEIDQRKQERETASKSNKGFQTELDAINASYEQIADVKAKAEQRRSLETEKGKIEGELENLSQDRMGLVSQTGALAFLNDTVTSVSNVLEDCRKKGELPYKIRRTFIDDLLHDAKCICGTELQEGSQARSALEGYRDQATGEDLEAAFTDVVSNLRAMPRERNRLYAQLSIWSAKESDFNKRIKAIAEELDEISSSLGSSDIEDVKRLEERRNELTQLQADERLKIIKAKDAIETLNDDLAKIKKEIDKVQSKSQKEDLARQKLEFAEACKSLIDNLHEALAEETRHHLSSKVNDTFQSILRKDFYAEIDSDYTLRIFKDIPGVGKQPVSEKSTGENQVISLSFIASLVNLAKERNKAKTTFFKGGVYPLIMDSPFGALDREYREKIAQHIPDLADQVIIFASNSQWSKEVDDKCRPFIGKEYSLVYHAPKSKGREEDSDYVKRTEGPEFTKIEEGYLGH
ncbi:AAA family ATPase [Sulfitobacter albidus]|uniref:AAA family ATPase n=1 Tax=Sulfitobacter albidus TaxID=2829501 RepID=A0A975JHM0_9RHOB|nr:AAA family ATPase [Sulfitobacter albidus]QUJ78341.1 AAA family ATPase [Sulfitobacter albidus]